MAGNALAGICRSQSGEVEPQGLNAGLEAAQSRGVSFDLIEERGGLGLEMSIAFGNGVFVPGPIVLTDTKYAPPLAVVFDLHGSFGSMVTDSTPCIVSRAPCA